MTKLLPSLYWLEMSRGLSPQLMSQNFEISGGRHPVVEHAQKEGRHLFQMNVP